VTTGNPTAAAAALYDASGGKITRAQLAIMTAIAGRESGWGSANPITVNGVTGTIQHGYGPSDIGSPGVGIGEWQITPGTVADLGLAQNAKDAWAKMAASLKASGNPFAPWEMNADGSARSYGNGVDYALTADELATGQTAAAAVFGGAASASGEPGVTGPAAAETSSSGSGWQSWVPGAGLASRALGAAGSAASSAAAAAGSVLSAPEQAILGETERIVLGFVGAVFMLVGLVIIATSMGVNVPAPSGPAPSGPVDDAAAAA
jgi:hypothetical protein